MNDFWANKNSISVCGEKKDKRLSAIKEIVGFLLDQQNIRSRRRPGRYLWEFAGREISIDL